MIDFIEAVKAKRFEENTQREEQARISKDKIDKSNDLYSSCENLIKNYCPHYQINRNSQSTIITGGYGRLDISYDGDNRYSIKAVDQYANSRRGYAGGGTSLDVDAMRRRVIDWIEDATGPINTE